MSLSKDLHKIEAFFNVVKDLEELKAKFEELKTKVETFLTEQVTKVEEKL